MDAYLICPETKKEIWLGKPIRVEDNNGALRVAYFHRGSSDGPWNHEIDSINKLLWKFLAEHAHKELRVVFSGEYDDDEFDRVAGDEVELEEYVRGWPARDPEP